MNQPARSDTDWQKPLTSRTLPRYLPQPDDHAKIARILIQVGEPLPDKAYRATAGGDERRLRGIPAIARGVAGAIPGSSPHANR